MTDVSRTRGKKGFDLLARRDGEELKIEVKGCTRPWHIPDAYATEFDAERRLVADFLYVVYFLETEARPILCVIPRAAIDPGMVMPRHGFRISGRFKNARVLQKFVVTGDDVNDV